MGKRYSATTLKGDLFGGVTAGIVALPLALAFGVQSGLGAIYGLYGAMILGMISALFGGTHTQISGPTGPMTVITAMVVTTAIEHTGSRELGMGIIIASFMLAGVLQIAFGLLRMGKVIRFMPYPVLSGFMSGIGLIIIIYQIYPLLGHISESNTLSILLNIQKPLSAMNLHSLGLGLTTIVIIYVFPKVSKSIPSPLIALITMTVISTWMSSEVRTIGAIPTGLPELHIDTLRSLSWASSWMIFEFACTLAALGAIDSLLTSVIADNLTQTKHNSNQELIGQGLGNMIAGMFGGLPGAGATMRTVVNINSGGTTRCSGFIHGLILLLIVVGLGHYVALIPLPVLAGILMTVGLGIIDYRGLKDIKHVPATDKVVFIVVLLMTVFGNLLHAVVVGLLMACVLFMKQASEQAEQHSRLSQIAKGTYVKDLQGPLFFGFTASFQEMMKLLNDDASIIIIKMDRVLSMDQSGLYALEQVIVDLQQEDIWVFLSDTHQQPLEILERTQVIPNVIPKHHVFETFDSCKVWIEKNLPIDA